MRPFVAHYDILFQSKDYDAEARTAARFLGVEPGADILEIGAGTGGHSLAFAANGYTVTAVEIDPEMAEIGQRKTSANDSVRWHVGTAGTAPADIADGACALFFVVNYVRGRRDLNSLLAAVRSRLPVSGRLTFDCWNGSVAMREEMPVAERVVDLPGGGTIWQQVETVVDVGRQEADLIYRFERRPADADPSRFEERFTIRLWTRRELEEILADASFRVLHVRDGRAPDEDAGPDSARLWITAEAIG